MIGIRLSLFLLMILTIKSGASIDSTLRGSIVPVFTPFNKNQRLALSVVQKYANFLSKSCIPAVLVAGTTGEGPSINLCESKRLLNTWMKAAKPLNISVYIEIGAGLTFSDTLELMKYCGELNVAGVFIIPGLYYPKNTVKAVVDDIEIISKVAPAVPIVFYDKAHSSVVSGSQIFCELSNRVPSFIGMKCEIDVALQTRALGCRCPKQTICVSNQGSVRAAYELGFNCSIQALSNVFPELTNQIESYAREGNRPAAQRAQARLNKIFAKITTQDDFLPDLKATMKIVNDISVGPPRLPQSTTSLDCKREITKSLRQLNVPLARPVN